MHIHSNQLFPLIILLFSMSSFADTLTRYEYLQSRNSVIADYDLAEKACDSLTSNANEICMAEANGKKRNALARLYGVYKPSANARYQELTTSANAAYAIALAKCNGIDVKDKSTCWSSAERTKINAINAAGMNWSQSLK